MPFFSIIMQSTLREYPGCAEHRDIKLQRAINSVLKQTFADFEFIIVSDDCQQTVDIVRMYEDERIVLIKAERVIGGKWSAMCRNIGLGEAAGQYVLYIDNDDFYAEDYLQSLHAQMQAGHDWYCVDHYEWFKTEWRYRRTNLVPNQAGTANIVHSSKMLSRWQDNGTYGQEDWIFIRRLMQESKNYAHLDVAGYYIAHKRGQYDK